MNPTPTPSTIGSTGPASGSGVLNTATDKTVQVWEASTGTSVLTYSGHADGVTSVTWSPDSTRIASASLDETVQVWQAR